MRKWVLTIYGRIQDCCFFTPQCRFCNDKGYCKKRYFTPNHLLSPKNNRAPDGRCCVQFSPKVQKQNKYPVIIISGILRISKIKVTDVQIQIADPTFFSQKAIPNRLWILCFCNFQERKSRSGYMGTKCILSNYARSHYSNLGSA